MSPIRTTMQDCMLKSISRSQRLLAFYNDQCPVVNSIGVLWVQLTPCSVRNFSSLATMRSRGDHRRPVPRLPWVMMSA